MNLYNKTEMCIENLQWDIFPYKIFLLFIVGPYKWLNIKREYYIKYDQYFNCIKKISIWIIINKTTSIKHATIKKFNIKNVCKQDMCGCKIQLCGNEEY